MIQSNKMISRFLLATCVLGLSACVMYPEPPPARSVEYGTYSCDASLQFVAQFQKEGTQVAFMRDGRTMIMTRDASGVYHNGSYSLTGGEEVPVNVFEDGVPIYSNCAPITTQPQYYQKKNKFRPFDVQRDLK